LAGKHGRVVMSNANAYEGPVSTVCFRGVRYGLISSSRSGPPHWIRLPEDDKSRALPDAYAKYTLVQEILSVVAEEETGKTAGRPYGTPS